MFIKYLKSRIKKYIQLFLWFLVGFIITQALFGKSENNHMIYAIILGLTLAEIVTFIKWLKGKKTDRRGH